MEQNLLLKCTGFAFHVNWGKPMFLCDSAERKVFVNLISALLWIWGFTPKLSCLLLQSIQSEKSDLLSLCVALQHSMVKLQCCEGLVPEQRWASSPAPLCVSLPVPVFWGANAQAVATCVPRAGERGVCPKHSWGAAHVLAEGTWAYGCPHPFLFGSFRLSKAGVEKGKPLALLLQSTLCISTL